MDRWLKNLSTFCRALFELILLIVLSVSCSSAKFSVKSDPVDASVSIRDKKTGQNKLIGKTPISMTMAELKSKFGDSIKTGEIFTIVVEKPGFATQNFSIPSTGFGTMATLVDVKMSAGDAAREELSASQLLDHLFLAQKFALGQQYERAQIEIDKILADFPDFPRALSMRASIYFAQKKWDESRKWYELALKADPKLEDAVRMIAKIRDMQGGRTPASAESTSSPAAPAAKGSP